MADTPSNAPLSEAEKQLAAASKLATYKKEIALANQEEAKLQKQLLDNQKAERDAVKDNLKGPDVKALDGKITATGNFIETQILAGRCISKLTEHLVTAIKDFEDFKVEDLNLVIYNAADFQNIELYLACIDQLNSLNNVLTGDVEEGRNVFEKRQDDPAGGFAPMAIGLAAGGILRSAIDIFSLFKSNSVITNYDIASDEFVLISGFVKKLKKEKRKWNVFYPSEYPVYLLGLPGDTTSEFIVLFTDVRNTAIKASTLQKSIENELSSIETELMTETDPVKKQQLTDRKVKLNAVLPGLQSSTAAFNQLEMTLLTVDANTKQSLRASVLQAEKLAMLLRKDNTYIIKLVAKLNGSTKIKENLLSMAKAVHSAGAQLNAVIFSKNGSILFSFERHFYESYKESSEIENASE